MQVSELGMREINEVPPPLDLTSQEIEALADDLVPDHAEFAELSYRVEQAHWGGKYLQGRRRPIERKALEPLALALAGGHVQAMQPCIGQGPWPDEPLRHQHGPWVDDTWGEADGVGSGDGSDCPKQGAHAVGVARQWWGRLGKVDNCQAGVCTAYASRQGYTLLDRRLYLPEAWCDAAPRERWRQGGIPDATPFQTKQALALEMWQALVQEGGLRWRWVTCDEALGRDGAFLEGTAALGRWYGAEGPHDTPVWLARPAPAVPAWTGRGRRPRQARLVPGDPAPQRVDQLAAAVPTEGGQTCLITEGSTGPLGAALACQRGGAVRGGLPGPDVWLVVRRTLGESPALTGSLSHAPAPTPVATLVRIAGMRWPIETAFEERTGGLGLDHDEVRTWWGWHHQMTLCLVAHHCLVRARLRVKKGRQR